MKKVMFGTLFALSLVACGGEDNTQEELSEEKKQEVVEIETTTKEVDEGTTEMTEEVESLGEDIDELLNDI